MIDAPHYELLNDLLVEIHRSLVQYAHEAWPWKHAGDEGIQQAVADVARNQEEHARLLFQFLLNSGHPPDLGIYPADFTSLHFVSLDFLYPLIVQGQKELVNQLQDALAKFPAPSEAQALVQKILTCEQGGLKKLESVSPPQPASRG